VAAVAGVGLDANEYAERTNVHHAREHGPAGAHAEEWVDADQRTRAEEEINADETS
jgi:hypothetical protein